MNKWIATLMAAVIATAAWAWPPRQNYAWQTSWRERFEEVDFPDNYPGLRLKLPPGTHSNLTVSLWMRWDNTQYKTYGVPATMWQPLDQKVSYPDILDGAGNFLSPIPYNFDEGGIELPGVTFTPYDAPQTHHNWPYGVYCVVGESEQPLTVVAGGVTLVVSNSFNRNFVPRSGTGVTVSGAGLGNIAIGRARFFQHYGQNITHGGEGALPGQYFEGMMTNEWKYVTWRLEATPQGSRSVLTMGDINSWSNYTSSVTANAAPGLHSDGLYEISIAILGSGRMDPIPWQRGRFSHGMTWATDEQLAAEWRRGRNGMIKRKRSLWLIR